MSEVSAYLRAFAERGYRDSDAAVFASVWERLERAYFTRIERAAAPCEGWRERFRAATLETAHLVEAFPEAAKFLAVDSLTAGEPSRRRHRALAARLVSLVDTARAELPDPDSVPAVTAGWVVAIFFDRVYRRCATGEGPDLPSQLPELRFLAVSAFFGAEAGLAELSHEP